MYQDSFIFVGNFCAAWLSRGALFMSLSRDNFFKTPTRLDSDAEKLMVLSALFTIRGGKLLYFIEVSTKDLWQSKISL